MGWRGLDSGYAFILIGIFIWATQAFITKILVTSMGFFSVYLFASLFSAITAFVFYFLIYRGKTDFSFLKDPKRIILISIFLGLTNFLLFASFGLLSASNVIILLYIYPIFMSIINSFVLRYKLSGKEIIGLALGFMGIFIFATRGNPLSLHIENLLANLMVLAAAVSWAIYLVIQKKYNFEEFSSNGFAFLLTTIYAIPLIFLVPSFLPHGLVIPSQNNLLLLLYFSIFTFALGNVIYVKGLKKTKMVNTALLTYLTPFIAVVLNYLVLAEQIFWYDLIPIAFIFVGYMIINTMQKKQK